MLYVCGINGDSINVIDTNDSIVETVTREAVFNLRKQGVFIAGVTDESIDVCNGAWLEDEFFQYCIGIINNKFNRRPFKSDEEIFKFLVIEFNSLYKGVKNLSATPVVSDSMYHFTADCIAEICRLHNMSCKVFKSGTVLYSEVTSTRVYKNLGITVYTYRTQDNKKAFRVMYS